MTSWSISCGTALGRHPLLPAPSSGRHLEVSDDFAREPEMSRKRRTMMRRVDVLGVHRVRMLRRCVFMWFYVVVLLDFSLVGGVVILDLLFHFNDVLVDFVMLCSMCLGFMILVVSWMAVISGSYPYACIDCCPFACFPISLVTTVITSL